MSAAPAAKPYISFHPNPSKPRFKLPPGAVDSHCHVFGPAAKFPFAPERKYTPTEASKEQLFALRDFLGFSRNVIVQATCHGKDNSALLDALAAAGDKARGVVTIGPEISDGALQAMDAAGVRGVRFNFVKRLVDFTPKDVLADIAARIAPLGWHVVVYFEAADLAELESFFTSLPTRVVVDHMGRPDVKLGVDHPQFRRFLDFMAGHDNIWSKVTCPERLSLAGAPYDDVVPFARTVVERFPDRVLSGTDWPHPNMVHEAPDDGMLVDYIPKVAVTPELQRKLLVDNPMRLYWSPMNEDYHDIPGTIVFDAAQSRLGYHLNMFCMSLMKEENRKTFKADEAAYLDRFPLTEAQRQAILTRDWNGMLAEGGNIYFTAKIAATDGLSFQQIAAKMTGSTQEDYAAMMLGGGRSPDGNRSKKEKSGG